MRLFFVSILLIVSTVVSSQTMVDGIVISNANIATNNASNDYIHLYQKYISGLKNGKCAMSPSCSNYGLIVYSQNNFFKATTLLCDRLIRCSHDKQYYNSTNEYGYRSYMDNPYNESVFKTSHQYTKKPHTDILKKSTDSTLLFINTLINVEDYIGALLEIQRAQFFDSTSSDELYAKKLLCFRALEHIEKGIYEYNVLFPTKIKGRSDVSLEMAKLHYLAEDYDNSIKYLNCIEQNTYQNINAFKGIAYAREEKFDSAYNYFLADNYLTEKIQSNYNLTRLQDLKSLKHKKTWIARFLSIVPGAGYLYAGHAGSALTSFLMNTILAYATYSSIKSNNYGIASVMGFFSISFYIGNINGAGRCAQRYNTMRKENIFIDLEKTNYIFNN